MIVYRNTAEVPAGFGPSAITIGKFDGVHTGHRTVLSELLSVAHGNSLTAVVVTFDRHPLHVIVPAECPVALASSSHKLDLLEDTGIHAVLELTFDEAFANISPRDFVHNVLVTTLRAKEVLVGADFRFGVRATGTVETLDECGRADGFNVRVVDDTRADEGRRVSSTWIRELLGAGDVSHAARLLGYQPTVRGIVGVGARRGRELGFPTANVSPDSEGLVPADGVYAGTLVLGGQSYPAAISVGTNPTFGLGEPRTVEAHVLDRDIDLYGKTVEVTFVERIRDMYAFESVPLLVETMHDDVRRARSILAAQS